MMIYNTNVDLVNKNVYTKFVSIRLPDIEKNLNYAGMTEKQNDGQVKSRIAPLFQSGAIITVFIINL